MPGTKDSDTPAIDPPKKHRRCEAAHTRYGGMRGILIGILVPCIQASELAERRISL